MRLFKLIKYIFKDAKERRKLGKYKNLFGIYMFVGDVGEGKTVSLVNHIKELKSSDPRIKVFTNFYYEGEDGRIEHWKDMLDVPSYSIIAIDEVQNTFNQRNWNSFPPELVHLITQNRKWGKDIEGEERPPGVRICFTTQDYENTDIMIRRLCNRVIRCASFFKGRMIYNMWYTRKEFEKTDEKRKRIKTRYFISDDDIRNSYNTYRILESMRSKDEDEKVNKKK